MKRTHEFCSAEIKLAKQKWPDLDRTKIVELRKLVCTYRLSIVLGDVLYIEGHWYVTHAGLLRLSERRRCLGIKTTLDIRCSDVPANRWVFKATVHKSPRSRGFVAYGDADPTNVSPLVRGAEMRVA